MCGRFNPAIATTMNVPEASVNKDHLFASRNDYVGLIGKIVPTNVVFHPQESSIKLTAISGFVSFAFCNSY